MSLGKSDVVGASLESVTAFLNREFSKDKTTVVIPMFDLFAVSLPPEELEEGYAPLSISQRVASMSASKRIEVIDLVGVLAAKRDYKLSIDSDRIILSPVRRTNDQDVSLKTGFELYPKEVIASWSLSVA
jgi:hypothetical protein